MQGYFLPLLNPGSSQSWQYAGWWVVGGELSETGGSTSQGSWS